ncbi:hypothetical protein [Cumulibacter manganitolerans]|uniref:hypothetical protein n=1 Tax=Cumulibacter manganitolerans TaxID=1884992 RepID=UPI001296A7CB|nr:hypothetical protein [Cumulibacter manganitolerans]
MYDPHEPLPFDPPPDDGYGMALPTQAGPARYRPIAGQHPNPANHGTPWTDRQHHLLVERIRAGDDLDAIADALGRRASSVLTRMRRLLPADNREHPGDLLLTVTRDYLADPEAPWRANLLRSTPPRPVITPPAIVRTGLGGIDDDDLVALVHAMITVHGRTPPDLLHRLGDELAERGLTGRLVRERARELRYSRDCVLSDAQLDDAAEAWVRSALHPDQPPSARYGDYWELMR